LVWWWLVGWWALGGVDVLVGWLVVLVAGGVCTLGVGLVPALLGVVLRQE
jgi:hypothetical protein